MFEQPDPTPEKRDRLNRKLSTIVAAVLMLTIVTYVSTGDGWRASRFIAGPGIGLLLIFSPIIIGRWMGARRKQQP